MHTATTNGGRQTVSDNGWNTHRCKKGVEVSFRTLFRAERVDKHDRPIEPSVLRFEYCRHRPMEELIAQRAAVLRREFKNLTEASQTCEPACRRRFQRQPLRHPRPEGLPNLALDGDDGRPIVRRYQRHQVCLTLAARRSKIDIKLECSLNQLGAGRFRGARQQPLDSFRQSVRLNPPVRQLPGRAVWFPMQFGVTEEGFDVYGRANWMVV